MENKIEKSIMRDIEKAKAELIKKAKRRGLYENFGDKEYSKIKDKYQDYYYCYHKHFLEFSEWASNYN